MTDTFTLDEVPEIHLERAPLAKVITQVRYSRTPGLVTDEGEDRIAGLLPRYPVRRQGISGQWEFGIGPDGAQTLQAGNSVTRILSDTDDQWRISLTESSVSLETSAYESRADFCQRTYEILSALSAVSLPPVVDRVGLRYIDRFSGESISEVPGYFSPTLKMLHGHIGEGLNLEYSVSDSVIKISRNVNLQVKSGLLPPMGGFDPALAPIPEPSWVLDLDIYTTQGGMAFDPDQLYETTERFAGIIHSFFRFATTDEFISSHRKMESASAEAK